MSYTPLYPVQLEEKDKTVAFGDVKLSTRQITFLSHYLEQNYNTTKACEATGIHKQTMYAWRRKDQDFKQVMEDVKQLQYMQLEDALHRRALDDERRSDNLLIFALKSHNPSKYCEKSQVEHVSRKDVKVTVQAEIAPGMEVIVPKVIEAEYHRVIDDEPGDNSQGQDLIKDKGTPLSDAVEKADK